MKLIRYSHTGWQPHFQSYMKDFFDHICNNCDDSNETFQKRKTIAQTFCWTGIHAFFENPSPKDVDFFLNHLDDDEIPPRHEKEWPDNTPAYSLYGTFRNPVSTIGKLREEGEIGAYLPIKDNETPF